MKNKILNELRINKEKYISGEYLSSIIGVSRTQIWKVVNELRNDGYVIESSSRKGYSLKSIPDILSYNEINCGLKTKVIGKKVECFSNINSTNDYAKKIAISGCDDGVLVVAECQTNGRGRLGREWESSCNKGIFMSVVLRPKLTPQEVSIITIAASVAVVLAIKEVTGIDTKIKWPNDIILDGKKVCGILTEMSAEMDSVNFVVLGIGMNVNQNEEDFSQDIKEKAVSLKIYFNKNKEKLDKDMYMKEVTRCDLIKEILFQLEEVYDMINAGKNIEIMKSWREYSATLGNEVMVMFKGNKFSGMAKNITEEGTLIVDCSDGITREILSGEVSIRGLLGYI